MEVRCPDCDVAMEEVTYRAGNTLPHVRTDETRDDLFGTLGLRERREVLTVLCPECGLLRQYADQSADRTGDPRE